MNERIKELADEARIKFSAHWAHQGVDTAVITRLDLKEFAELIVRQCAEVGLDSVEDGDDLDAIMKRVHNNILTHFGVEE
jgi:hypothetical protein